MAPTFLKFNQLRRRSRASIRTDPSTDTSSDGALSHGTAPSSGSLTPPSIAQQSDPALHMQLKDSHSASSQHQQQTNSQTRPPLAPSNSSKRHSVSGMSGLGAPSITGRQNLPVSPYAPRLHNVSDNAWV